MKKLLFLSVFAFFVGSLHAQEEHNVCLEVVEVKPAIESNLNEGDSDDNTIYLHVQEKAQYPGGNAELAKFIKSNLQYPKEALADSVHGKVIVDFVIEKNGSVSDAHIARSVHPALDKEALRVVKIMKGWIPAKNNGKAVRSKSRLPITFSLEK